VQQTYTILYSKPLPLNNTVHTAMFTSEGIVRVVLGVCSIPWSACFRNYYVTKSQSGLQHRGEGGGSVVEVTVNSKTFVPSTPKDSASGVQNPTGIDRPFQGGVKSSLIRSLFINWRLGNFFSLILKGFHHKISKKLIDAA
jgi:hypothetical protein